MTEGGMSRRFRAGLVQMRSGRDPAANIAVAESLIREAAGEGAQYVLTPEMTNIMNREAPAIVDAIASEPDDPALASLRALARDLGIYLHIGSLAIKAEDGVANRGYLIAPTGAVIARYDKIHMFDVDLAGGDTRRESKLYRPGSRAVAADLPWARLGLSICYDLRFPQLYRSLAHAGAQVLAIPSAFTRQTGQAHWHILLRARAIETGSFVLAAAQGGRHEDGRETYGHSLIVDPWGRILAEAGEDPGVVVADIDVGASDAARAQIPVLQHDRDFDHPEKEPPGRAVA
ncbi:MAG: carbon-nitrogen hydrolase family protein [Bauldia sp.]|nr:carbon-nitrogen hydrolase family protein [Bauldia sp.]MCW5719449.1 carbon-nitrogen hydrolase family protein [Bauldia sp.]